ncbi:MAG: 3-oxoacid CoA-transferase subunit B [Candidatus Velthaea sp.]
MNPAAKPLSRDELAWRVAQDLPDGAYVNLGIGLPTRVAQFVPRDREVVYHSENGLLGVGPPPRAGEEDPELVNAGKQMITLVPGAAIFDHPESFMIIRGGHIDVALLGAYQVAANGDLANWSTDQAGMPPGVGGAMDLAAGAKRVWALMEHTMRDGSPRLLERCTYPLTAPGVVSRIYTNYAVIDVADGFVVREIIEGCSIADLQGITGAPLRPVGQLGIIARP